MRCNALNCVDNENGYCTIEPYTEIDSEGRCEGYYVMDKYDESEDENK